MQQTKSRRSLFILGTVFGIFLSVGFSGLTSIKNGRVWFKVYEPAAFPEGAWFGFLCNEATGNKTDIIVDFGKKLNLAKDDRLEGVYVPTTETGQWNKTPYRIYTLNGNFKIVDPLSVK